MNAANIWEALRTAQFTRVKNVCVVDDTNDPFTLVAEPCLASPAQGKRPRVQSTARQDLERILKRLYRQPYPEMFDLAAVNSVCALNPVIEVWQAVFPSKVVTALPSELLDVRLPVALFDAMDEVEGSPVRSVKFSVPAGVDCRKWISTDKLAKVWSDTPAAAFRVLPDQLWAYRACETLERRIVTEKPVPQGWKHLGTVFWCMCQTIVDEDGTYVTLLEGDVNDVVLAPEAHTENTKNLLYFQMATFGVDLLTSGRMQTIPCDRSASAVFPVGMPHSLFGGYFTGSPGEFVGTRDKIPALFAKHERPVRDVYRFALTFEVYSDPSVHVPGSAVDVPGRSLISKWQTLFGVLSSNGAVERFGAVLSGQYTISQIRDRRFNVQDARFLDTVVGKDAVVAAVEIEATFEQATEDVKQYDHRNSLDVSASFVLPETTRKLLEREGLICAGVCDDVPGATAEDLQHVCSAERFFIVNPMRVHLYELQSKDTEPHVESGTPGLCVRKYHACIAIPRMLLAEKLPEPFAVTGRVAEEEGGSEDDESVITASPAKVPRHAAGQ